MTQKFEVREANLPKHERYYGTACYVDLYQRLEHEMYADRTPVSLPI